MKSNKLGTPKQGNQQFRKDTAPYRAASVPSKLLLWLTGKNFWKEKSRLQVHGVAQVVGDRDDTWDTGTPCMWSPGDEGAQRWWLTLLSCWGARLQSDRLRLAALVAKRPDLKGKAMLQIRPSPLPTRRVVRILIWNEPGCLSISKARSAALQDCRHSGRFGTCTRTRPPGGATVWKCPCMASGRYGVKKSGCDCC